VPEEDRTVRSRIAGEGILNWEGILQKLKAIGYDGWISFEYERRWHMNDLPNAKIGIKKEADYISKILERI